MKKKMAEIDGERLLAAIKANGYDPYELSEEIGFSRGHLSQSAFRGCINMPSVKLLEQYGIPLSEYEKVEEKHPLRIDPVEVVDEMRLPWDLEEGSDPPNYRKFNAIEIEPHLLHLTDEDIAALEEAMVRAFRKALNE